MDFFRVPVILPKYMSKKRINAADLAEKSESDEPIGTDNTFPSDSSLDECFNLARDADGDAFDRAVRRLSDESVGGSCGSGTSSGSDSGSSAAPGSCSRRSSSTSSAASRVSFVDEEFSLESRHVVTEVHYRPRTTMREKPELFYGRRDFIAFEKEHLCERIKDKMREIKSGPVDAKKTEEVRELCRQAQRLYRYQ